MAFTAFSSAMEKLGMLAFFSWSSPAKRMGSTGRMLRKSSSRFWYKIALPIESASFPLKTTLNLVFNVWYSRFMKLFFWVEHPKTTTHSRGSTIEAGFRFKKKRLYDN